MARVILEGGKSMQDRAPEEEEALVSRARAGDLSAFERLIAKYERPVFNIALYKSRNFFDAEDLSQDIFLAAYEALPTLKEPSNFAGWLFGIAYNRCHKWFRRERNKILKIQEIKERAARDEKRRLRPSTLAGSPGLPGGSGSAATEHFSEAFLRLPTEIRETLRLKYLEGLSYEEIEARLGINSNRIDYLIRKGKQMIRDRVERTADEGPG